MSGPQGVQNAHDFRFVAAPPDLSHYVNSLYVWRSASDVSDILPAYSGQMVVFAQGHAEMQFDHGAERTRDAFFLAPLCKAREFVVHGPATLFGVSLNFRGWAALTGLAVNACHDRFLDAEAGLPKAAADRIAQLAPAWRAGRFDEEQVLDALADIVRQGLAPLPDTHRHVIDSALEWASSSFRPELDSLYAALPYSRRQSQRLVAHFFGLSPKRLLRRYRAIRAATLLSMPELPEALETEIREAFYDQAHLIKEIRFFTGRTPKRLHPDDASPVSDMLGPEGYGAGGLFGAGEAHDWDEAQA